MRVLVGCEYSGRMRRAFAARGHEAWSCDLLPAEDGETARHHVGDVVAFSRASQWDLCVFHPPERWKMRSRTFGGMARACAEQWGG